MRIGRLSFAIYNAVDLWYEVYDEMPDDYKVMDTAETYPGTVFIQSTEDADIALLITDMKEFEEWDKSITI